jgi:hypothetical protein
MKRRGRAAEQGLVQSVEIEGCGHAPALMSAEQAALIEDFLFADAASAKRSRARAV